MATFTELGGGPPVHSHLAECVKAYLEAPVDERRGCMIICDNLIALTDGRPPQKRFEDDDLAWLVDQLSPI